MTTDRPGGGAIFVGRLLLWSLPLIIGLAYTGLLAVRGRPLDHGLMLAVGGAIALAVFITRSRAGSDDQP